jgi:PAS domain S-box-containing protein
MGAAPVRADSWTVATAALTTATAEERVQRLERRLIEASLAVNEAPTLEAALMALTETAAALSEADWIAILEWDASAERGQLLARTHPGALDGRFTVTDGISQLIRADSPFVLTGPLLAGVDPAVAEAVSRWGTFLVIPVVAEGQPPLTICAGWREPRRADEVELAMSKLRLLGRLTRIAYRAEAERIRALDGAQLRAVLESVPDGLVIRTDESVIVNPTARTLLGVGDQPPEALRLRTLEGTPVPPDATPLQLAKRTGVKQEYILRVPRGDGVERIHEGTIAPVTDEHGKVVATVTLFRDVTAAHERRWVADQFLQRLFEELPLAVGLVDPATGEIVSANDAYLQLVGYSGAEVIGAREPYPWWADPTPSAHVLDETQRVTYERLFRRKSGELVPVEITRSMIRDPHGEPSAVVVLITDLSERRAFEQQLIQSGKLASIGELAAGVAHEINNPLFAILGFVEFLLADAEPGSKAHERLKVIQNTAFEIKEIVRALLDFARERGDERSTISLVDVAAETVSLMRRMSAKKDVEIVERYCRDDVVVHGSANQLKQIFVNLFSEARRAMPQGGTVAVEVGREGESAVARIAGSGPGVPEDVLRLGVSISLGIARLHGGDLTVQSRPGEGPRFTLSLPAAARGEGAA